MYRKTGVEREIINNRNKKITINTRRQVNWSRWTMPNMGRVMNYVKWIQTNECKKYKQKRIYSPHHFDTTSYHYLQSLSYVNQLLYCIVPFWWVFLKGFCMLYNGESYPARRYAPNWNKNRRGNEIWHIKYQMKYEILHTRE